ncbi:hypothetical protein STEG23_012956, partial [Scotinomys teguina]
NKEITNVIKGTIGEKKKQLHVRKSQKENNQFPQALTPRLCQGNIKSNVFIHPNPITIIDNPQNTKPLEKAPYDPVTKFLSKCALWLSGKSLPKSLRHNLVPLTQQKFCLTRNFKQFRSELKPRSLDYPVSGFQLPKQFQVYGFMSGSLI